MNTPVRLVLAALGGVLALAAFGLLAFIAGAVTGTPAAAAQAPTGPVVVVPSPLYPTPTAPATIAPLPAPRVPDGPVESPVPAPSPSAAPTAHALPIAPAVPAPGESAEGSAATRGNAADTKASGIYSDGTYLVGADIAPGDYWTNGPDVGDMAFWSRLSDTSGSMDSIIANGIVQGPTTITIAPSDHAIKFSGHAAWTKR